MCAPRLGIIAIGLALVGCMSQGEIPSPDAEVIIGLHGASRGELELKLPWLKLHITDANKAECRARSIAVEGLGGQLEVRVTPFADGIGDFEARAIIREDTAPIITAKTVTTAVAEVARALAAKCLQSGNGPNSPAVRAAAQVIVASLPHEAKAELALTYGLSRTGARAVIDIVPGMRLRVNTSQPLKYLESGQRYYPGATTHVFPRLRQTSKDVWEVDAVGELGDLGFRRPTPAQNAQDNTTKVAGIQDLRAPAGREQRYWRLYMPAESYVALDNVVEVEKDPEPLDQSAIIASAKAESVLPKETLKPADCKRDTITCFQFKGRGTVVPEIAIFVRGTARWVPLGTTVGDIAAEVVAFPRGAVPSPGDSYLYAAWAKEAWSGLTIRRRTVAGEHKLVLAPSSNKSDVGTMSIPLIAGDALKW